MPLFGAHMSVAGGVWRALDHMKAAGANSLQLFTKNQRRWESAPISDSDALLFRQKWEEFGRPPLCSHGSYLVNPAALDEETARKSVANLADELLRCKKLGIDLVVIHPGAHGGAGPEAGMEAAARRIDEGIEASGVVDITILLENTAGQGTWLGADFSELAGIISHSRHADLLGVCVDTCHAFGAGYELVRPEGYAETFSCLDREVGLKRLRWFHLNDSLTPLGSHRDRHTHIGKGEIGLEGFRNLVNDPRFSHHPMALETPKEDDLEDDRINLAVLRGLCR